jgi:signal transduction histidine kinase
MSIEFLVATLLLFLSATHHDVRATNQEPTRSDDPLRWQLVESPTKNDPSSIAMVSPTRGYIGGSYLLSYDGKAWSLDIRYPASIVYAAGERNVWRTSTNYSYSSDFFRLEGKNWHELANPLANQISTMHLARDGSLWLGGDRELAYHDGRSWKFLPVPDVRAAIVTIAGAANGKTWALTSNNKLFYFDGAAWKQFFKNRPVYFVWFEHPQHGFALTAGELFEYRDFEWRLHSNDAILTKITKLAVLTNGELWGIGPRGTVAHFDRHQWSLVPVPTDQDLLDVQMLAPDNGWIVGRHGVILHYSAGNQERVSERTSGFQPMKIAPVSKEINDEYGIAIDDVNGDGLKDIYAICIFEPNRLYINRGSRSAGGNGFSTPLNFYEEAVPRRVTGVTGDSSFVGFSELYLGVGLADVDNDGDQDFYLCNLTGKNKLLLNNGSGFFRNVSTQEHRAAGKLERTNAAVFGDVDNDGDLDLFIANEMGTNRLYLNDGNGYFTDVTDQAGFRTEGGGMSASFGDIDGDGKLDLVVANWSQPNLLYHNESDSIHGVRFVEIAKQAGVAGESYSKSNAVVFADVNNDGALDLFVTNRKTPNRLYLNDGSGHFRDATAEMLGLDTMMSYGASIADFDNDGYLDLFVANVGENVLYRNVKGKKFVRATSEFGAQHDGYCTGTATGDIDNDGDIDLYVANYINGSSVLFVNQRNDRHFLMVDVEGTSSNRDAVGAKVWLYAEGHAGQKDFLLGYREVHSGSGYGSRSARQLHFGVPEENVCDVVVSFPASGVKKIIRNVRTGTWLKVTEEDGLGATWTLTVKALRRFVSDPEVHFEALKFGVVLLFISLSSIYGRKKYGWNRRLLLAVHGGVFVFYWIQIAIFLHEPFHVSTLLPLVSVAVVLIVAQLLYDRVIMVRLARQQRQQTRDRIARDLHDDIASTLSSTLIYTDALRHMVKNIPQREKEMLDKISALLNSAADSMADIVWTVSPQHDTLADLLVHLRVYIADICKANGVKHESNIAVDGRQVALPDDVRRNMYLIFKEALHNALKHAHPSHVQFAAALTDGEVTVFFKDNGRGFDPNTRVLPRQGGADEKTLGSSHGHGLRNMNQRAEEIGAILTIESAPGKGTMVRLVKKMT